MTMSHMHSYLLTVLVKLVFYKNEYWAYNDPKNFVIKEIL